MKKTCPSCQSVCTTAECACGYNFCHEPCPGCDRRIDTTQTSCPHCNYDLVDDRPTQVKVKPAPPPKKVVAKPAAAPSPVKYFAHKGRTYTPALHGRTVYKFQGDVNSDTDILHWVAKVRETWEEGYLTNEAIVYICMYAHEAAPLKSHYKRVGGLLGVGE